MRACGLCLLVLVFAAGSARTMDLRLDRRAIEEAVTIGQSSMERERARFHEPYRSVVARPPVDYIEVVTPFRRVVVAAQLRANLGDRRFGQAEAMKVLEDSLLQLGVYVEITFHPFNTYVGVPEYLVALTSETGAQLEPLSIDRIARFGPRLESLPLPYPYPGPSPALPKRSLPMLGATVVANFDGRLLDPNGVYAIVVTEQKKEVARVRVGLSRLR